MPDFLAQPSRPLLPGDPVAGFDCGIEELNRYLHRFAWVNQQASAAMNYVAIRDRIIAGYFSLAAGAIQHGDSPDRLKKGLARHPIPVLLLARLAVDRRFQGVGIGGQLVRDAARRALTVAGIAGIRALVVDAKDERAQKFYERFNFQPLPAYPLRLFVLTKDLQAIAG